MNWFKRFQVVGFAVIYMSLTGFTWLSTSDIGADIPYEMYYPKWMEDFRFYEEAPVAQAIKKNGSQEYLLKIPANRLDYLEEVLLKQFKKYCRAVGGTVKYTRCLDANGKPLGEHWVSHVSVPRGEQFGRVTILHSPGKVIEETIRRINMRDEARKKFIGTNGPTGKIQLKSGEEVSVLRFGTFESPYEYISNPQEVPLTEMIQMVSDNSNGGCHWHAELWDGTNLRDINNLFYYMPHKKGSVKFFGKIHYVSLTKEGDITEGETDCFETAKIIIDRNRNPDSPADNRDFKLLPPRERTQAEIQERQKRMAVEEATRKELEIKQAAADALARQAATKKEKEAQIAISAFRKSIQVGDESHCGLVIKVRKPLAQIQTPAGEQWMKIDQTFPIGLGNCQFLNPQPLAATEAGVVKPAYDNAGRQIIYGPVRERHLSNVHIISNSYGVVAMDGAVITDSVIEAPVCVQSSGLGLTLKRNDLNCQLGVEFTGSILMNNTLDSNRFSGRLSNRDF